MEILNATGRRKDAIARVNFKAGKGNITINKKDYKDYFSVNHLFYNIEDPLQLCEIGKEYDISVNVSGGGIKGQAEAIRLGISRILCEINPEFRPRLKAKGYLKRDPRSVERKKPGLRKARKKEQYSKR